MDVYCVKEKRFTPNVPGSEKITTTENGRRLLKVKCASCGITKTKFMSVQEGGNFLDPVFKWASRGLPKKKREDFARAEKRLFGGGVFDTVGDTAAEAFIEYGVPYLAKQGVKQGRYFASEFLREPEYQKRLASKAKPIARKAVNYTIDALSGDLLNKASNKLRPKDMIPGNMLKGGCHKSWQLRLIPHPIIFLKLYRMDVYCVREKRFTPNVPGSEKITTTENGRRVLKVKCESCGITKTRFLRDGDDPTNPQSGQGFDLHKAIGKLPKPKKGWTLPGHNYTGPYNPLDKQLSYDPQTGKILKIYQQPTGATDAVSMQHDVDYAVCAGKKNEKGCKHEADKKMVKALDAIPKNKRQWGHAAARNAIASKQKVGLGVGETINKSIGDKIPGFSQAQAFYTFLPGVDKQLLDNYWSGDIAKGAFNTKTGLFSKKFWSQPSKKTDASCNKVVYDKKSGKWRNMYC